MYARVLVLHTHTRTRGHTGGHNQSHQTRTLDGSIHDYTLLTLILSFVCLIPVLRLFLVSALHAIFWSPLFCSYLSPHL